MVRQSAWAPDLLAGRCLLSVASAAITAGITVAAAGVTVATVVVTAAATATVSRRKLLGSSVAHGKDSAFEANVRTGKRMVEIHLYAVSYPHLTMPTNREV